jgi:hypothetical protein
VADLYTQGPVRQFLSADPRLCTQAATGACPPIGDSTLAVVNVV